MVAIKQTETQLRETAEMAVDILIQDMKRTIRNGEEYVCKDNCPHERELYDNLNALHQTQQGIQDLHSATTRLRNDEEVRKNTETTSDLASQFLAGMAAGA